MSLEKRSLTELRGLAQSLGVVDVFKKPKNILMQEIVLKQEEAMQKPMEPITPPVYDARLMSKPPSKKSDIENLLDLLEQHIQRGLVINFPHPEWWEMRFNMKTDSGTMRQPLQNVLRCANKLMSK
jgi:hypothetical protein